MNACSAHLKQTFKGPYRCSSTSGQSPSLLIGAELTYLTIGWLLEFYILATPRVISGWLPTCDSAQSWPLYSAAPLGNQAASTMTSIIFISHRFDSTGKQTPDLPYTCASGPTIFKTMRSQSSLKITLSQSDHR